MDKRVLDKIKKLMALAGSNNPHEAAIALRKAQLLMQEHQLSEADVELSDIAESCSVMANASEKQPQWSLNLMAMIKQTFGVSSYFSVYQRRVFFCRLSGPSRNCLLLLHGVGAAIEESP